MGKNGICTPYTHSPTFGVLLIETENELEQIGKEAFSSLGMQL